MRRSNRNLRRNLDILNRYLNGEPEREIGESYGISQQHVSRIIRQLQDPTDPGVAATIRSSMQADLTDLMERFVDLALSDDLPPVYGKDDVILKDEKGEIVRDVRPIIAAAKVAIAASQRLGAHLGTDAAQKIEASTTTRVVIEGVDMDKL